MKTSIDKNRLAAALAVAGFGLAGCSAGGAPASVTQAKLSGDILKVSVGTANIFGDVAANAVTGLNVAATYRQPAGALHPGDSAVLVSTPTLTGPFTLPAAGTAGTDPTSTVLTGPAPGEIGTGTITGTAQTGTTVTSLGTSGGVFGLGIEPFNYGDGSPFSVAPYPVPLYDALSGSMTGDPNQFVPWGGVPAFDLAGNGQSVIGNSDVPSGQAGISEGLDVFEGVKPGAGLYTLSVNVPANTSQPTFKATATLASTALLGPATAPVPTLDATGGGSFAAALPAGVTEAYFQITDFGPANGLAGCNGAANGSAAAGGGAAANPIYYTIEVTAATPRGTLPDAAGPSGTPSLCTAAQNTTAATTAAGTSTTSGADQFTVQTIGFDYPLYESSYVTGTTLGNPSPTLTGANGQSDITISTAAEYTVGTAGATLLARHLTNPIVRIQMHRKR